MNNILENIFPEVVSNIIIRFSIHPIAELIKYEMNGYSNGWFSDSYDFPSIVYYFYFHTFERDEFNRKLMNK